MAAPPLANTFEGGSNTTAITTGNSGGGSGDAFNGVVISGTTTWTYSTDQARNVLSGKMSMGGTGANTWLEWSSLGAITGNLYARFYMHMVAFGTGTIILGFSYDNVGTAVANRSLFLRLLTTGELQIQDQGSVTIATAGAGAITAGAWYRVEVRVNPGAGTAGLRVYSSPDSATPSASDDPGTVGTLAANVDRVRLGVPSAGTAFVNGVLYFDDLALSTTGWIGPTGTGLTPPYVSVTVA